MGDSLTRSNVGVLPVLHSIAGTFDIFVMNFGLWHHSHSPAVYTKNLHLLGKFYNESKGRFPNQFFMETPKQHFSSFDGDWSAKWFATIEHKSSFTCKPVIGVSFTR